MRLRNWGLLAACAWLSACVLVDDFGRVWEQSRPDPCLERIAQSLYYAEFSRDPARYQAADVMRGFTWHGQHYLLLKKAPDDKGGRLYRFRVKNGIFERFRLAPTKRADFAREFPDAPVSLARDTVTLAMLDDTRLALLDAVAKRADYWEVEDKILYNPQLNPTCRFEDRDLKKLK